MKSKYLTLTNIAFVLGLVLIILSYFKLPSNINPDHLLVIAIILFAFVGVNRYILAGMAVSKMK